MDASPLRPVRAVALVAAALALAVSVAPPARAVDAFAFVPVVLTVDGVGGSHFTSEMTLTNRGTSGVNVLMAYTAEVGGGTGTTSVSLSPGAQLVIADVIAFLTQKGLPIDAVGNRLGTLALQFQGASSSDAVAATIRTTTPVPPSAPIGRAGLAYLGIPQEALLTGPAYLSGLRISQTDRTNVAIQNPTGGDVQIRISYFDGAHPSTTPAATRVEMLASGHFRQLTLADIAPGATQGWIRTELVSGAAYNAYAVVNDNANSDGSFIRAVLDATLAGRTSLVLPVVVETGTFTTELAIANASGQTKTVHLVYSAAALTTGDHTVSTDLTLAPGEQRIIDGFVQSLRTANPSAVPSGPTYTGPLLATVAGGDMTGILLGARVLNPGGGGRYGLFFQAQPTTLAVPYSPDATEAFVYGLQQNGENRTNVAFVNVGDVDSSPIVLRVEVFDGATGAKVADLNLPSLGAKGFTQVNAALATWAPGVTQAYARVTKVSGTNRFLVYAVVNDGASPGLRSGDGAFVPMQTKLVTTENFGGAWTNTSSGSTGSMAMKLEVNHLVQTFNATITLGGNVFGQPIPPAPFTIPGTYRESGTTTTTQSTPLGNCTVTSTAVGPGFQFSSSCTVPQNDAGITKFDFAGAFDGNFWIGTYKVTFNGGSANGTFTMSRI
jgi:hypothetical protein